MRLPHRFTRTARFAALLVAHAALCAPGLRAQESTSDGGLSRVSNNNPFGSVSPELDMRRSEPAPLPVYFPPDPPPLDQLPKRNLTASRWSNLAPEELAAYVNEPFYPELAARLEHDTLSQRQRDTLQRYRSEIGRAHV